MKAPVAQNQSSKSRNSRAVVTHTECERVGTVQGSVAFASVGNYAANPGLKSSFPWLGELAELYERYTFEKFIVRYKNLKGTGSNGNILISFDYDTLDAGPTTAIQQTQSTVWIDGAPWRIFEMNVPVDGIKRFIRSGEIAGADLKTYDFGRVWVSAEGCADTSSHGYLEFEYSVKLFEKQPAGSGTGVSNQGLSIWNMPANQASGGATITLDIDEAIALPAIAPPTNLNGVVTLPLGNFMVTAQAAHDSNAGTAGSIEILQDGASLPIPALGQVNLYGASPVTTFIRSVGGTTIQVRFNRTNGSPTFQGDMCRLIVEVV